MMMMIMTTMTIPQQQRMLFKILTIILIVILPSLQNNKNVFVVFTNANEDSQSSSLFQCRIYLAQSSIPNAGFGIYTTQTIPPNQYIYTSSTTTSTSFNKTTINTTTNNNNNYKHIMEDTPSIPVTDFYEPNGNDEKDWNQVDYIWEPMGRSIAFESDEVCEISLTFGSLCNFHTVLTNLLTEPSGYDDLILDRYQHPGAGAISYHTGRKWKSSRTIEAGEELFVDYGEEWLDNRKDTYADDIARTKDYYDAIDIISLLKTRGYEKEERYLVVLKDIVSILNHRVGSLIPPTKDEFRRFAKRVDKQIAMKKSKKTRGGYVSKKSLATTLAKHHLNHNPNDVDDNDDDDGNRIAWIEQNGICLEKIRTGMSGVDGAGRGSFAQMFIAKDEIISPAPLLNIPNIDSLLIYNTTTDDNGERIKVVHDDDGDNGQPIGYQLIMNYCFGHKKSRLILCPQTNMIMMNHCSDRVNGMPCQNGMGPNAKIRWATNSSWDSTTSSWINKSLEEITMLTEEGRRGLSFEVIATRDIVEGEEIFLDYGVGWENAWMSHVKNWKPPIVNTTAYMPLGTVMKENDLRTVEEVLKHPYAENMNMYCYGGVLLNADDSTAEEEIDAMKKSFIGDMDEPENLLKCEIIQKGGKGSLGNSLKVRIFHKEGQTIVTNFPRKSVRMMINPYTSDQHLEGSFRHFIEIDDSIFPEQWIDDDDVESLKRVGKVDK